MRLNSAVHIAVNTRCLLSPVTGVQRYTRCVLDELRDSLVHLSPRPIVQKLGLGNIWDQTVLPFRSRGYLLWSPANVGPITVSRQVLTLHDVSVLDNPEWFSRSFSALYHELLPRLVPRVRRVITDSEFGKRRILEIFKIADEKVVVIPLAAARHLRRPDQVEIDRIKALIGLPDHYLLVVGSIDPRKNLKRVLDAWHLASNKLDGVFLVIAGGHARTFRVIELGPLPPRMIFLGRVVDEMLPAIYAGASALLYPSLYEGFGLPVLEAMMCGTPVITSNTTSIPEVAGDAAIYVDPRDAGEIASGILKLFQGHGIGESLTARGYARAMQFSWERTAAATWDVLQNEADA